MNKHGYSCGFASLSRRILLVLQLWAAVSAERPLPLQPGSSQGQRQTNRKKVGQSPSAASLSTGNVRSLQVTSKVALVSLASSEGKLAIEHAKDAKQFASQLEPELVAKGTEPVGTASATIASAPVVTAPAAATTASPATNAEPTAPTAVPQGAVAPAAATTASPATNAEPTAPTAAPEGAVVDSKSQAETLKAEATTEAPKAEASTEAPKAESTTEAPKKEAKEESEARVVAQRKDSGGGTTVKEMDRQKIMQLVPEVKDFQTALRQRFSGPSSGQCLAVDGPDYKYGCGWKPADRSNMTIKDEHTSMCACQTLWTPLQRCWQPDISEFLGYFEKGDLLTATETGKAYLAGRCYIPFYIWFSLGSFVFLFACGGCRTLRDKSKDPRLKGSALDPNRIEH